jgi:hypothetical protein
MNVRPFVDGDVAVMDVRLDTGLFEVAFYHRIPDIAGGVVHGRNFDLAGLFPCQIQASTKAQLGPLY